MKNQVIFHSGCFGCTQQELHDVEFCYDCRYFNAEWDKPDLSNRPPNHVDIIRAEVIARRERWRSPSKWLKHKDTKE